MKRFIAFGLLLVLSVLCLARSNGKVKRPGNADDLLKTYAQRIHVELLPHASEMTHEEVIRSVGEISAEVLAPDKKLLSDKAKAELAKLPKLTVDMSSGWETVLKLEQGWGVANRFAAELRRGTPQPETRPIDRDGVLLAVYWNPKEVISTVRSQVLGSHLGIKDYSKRSLIEKFAPPIVYAISADPQRPVVAIKTGPELFIVNLKLTEAGYYVDEKVQWLKRKSTASQPAKASSKD